MVMEIELVKLPPLNKGLRHVALNAIDLHACVYFYTEILGMQIEWQPDDDNYYLSSGQDNLALHRAAPDFKPGKDQHLDHIGFILDSESHVDQWYEYLSSQSVEIVKQPRTHRDGARSFYCKDPDGNVVQMMYHPPLAKNSGESRGSRGEKDQK